MSGAGVTINPIAFLVIQQNNVKLMPVNHSSSIDKLLDYVPDLMEKANGIMNKCVQNKKDEVEKVIKQMQKKQCKENDKNDTNQENVNVQDNQDKEDY